MKKIKMLFPSNTTIQDAERWIEQNGETRISEFGLKPANYDEGLVAEITWDERC